jgi:hypothetical protein
MVYNTQNYCFFFGLFPSSVILENTTFRQVKVGEKTPTQLGPLERAKIVLESVSYTKGFSSFWKSRRLGSTWEIITQTQQGKLQFFFVPSHLAAVQFASSPTKCQSKGKAHKYMPGRNINLNYNIQASCICRSPEINTSFLCFKLVLPWLSIYLR